MPAPYNKYISLLPLPPRLSTFWTFVYADYSLLFQTECKFNRSDDFYFPIANGKSRCNISALDYKVHRLETDSTSTEIHMATAARIQLSYHRGYLLGLHRRPLHVVTFSSLWSAADVSHHQPSPALTRSMYITTSTVLVAAAAVVFNIIIIISAIYTAPIHLGVAPHHYIITILTLHYIMHPSQ